MQEPVAPVVVVDTTAIFDDLRLRRLAWMQLLALCAKEEIGLVVPNVVIRESVRHWKRQADQAVKVLHAEIRKLKNFGLDAGEGPAPGLADAEAHAQYLRERLMNVGAQLPGLPQTATPEKLLERDLGERKPFASSGKGFRDALNWETILELAAQPDAPHIFWVTKNSADFSDGKGGLHEDLLGELSDPQQITWVSTLEDLVKRDEFRSLIDGLAASPEELEQYLASALVTPGRDTAPQGIDDFVRDALVNAAERLVGDSVGGHYGGYEGGGTFDELDLPSEVYDMTIEYVEADPDTVQWQVYESFDGTTLLVAATIRASLSIEGFTDKSDALQAEGFEVREFDWNNHVSWVSFTRDAVLGFQLRVEEGVGVDYVELESAESG